MIRLTHAGAARSATMVAGLLIALGCTSAHAVVSVAEAWIRPARAGQSTDAYMELTDSEGATLTGASTPVAAKVELVASDGRPVAGGVDVPAKRTVMFAPRASHLRLARLARDLDRGARVPLTLRLRNLDGTEHSIDLDAEVRLRSPTEDHRKAHAHH